MKYSKKARLHHVPEHVFILIKETVTCPIAGFDQKSTSAGTAVSKKQQLSNTHQQILLAAEYYSKKGYPEEKIMRIIGYFQTDQEKN